MFSGGGGGSAGGGQSQMIGMAMSEVSAPWNRGLNIPAPPVVLIEVDIETDKTRLLSSLINRAVWATFKVAPTSKVRSIRPPKWRSKCI